MPQSSPEKLPPDKSSTQKFLSSVSYDRGFHFFSDIGRYTGETAINLFSFYEELRTIEPSSVKFHFGRGDFQNWIAGTLGDTELAEKINKIGSNLSTETLRKELLNVIRARLEDLQALAKRP
jgi:hypothetical protein